MRILAVIPARGGSKGLPGKNIRLLGDKPLIAHTIEAAVTSACVDRIVVSTDDPEIAEISKRFGAEVPFLRPEHLSGDLASAIDVVIHAIEYFSVNEGYVPDGILLLQPTSPLRSATDIRNSVEMFVETGASVIGLRKVSEHPYLMKQVDESGEIQPLLGDLSIPSNRQQLPPIYMVNGAIYLSSPENLISHKSFYLPAARPYIMPEERSIDIDSLEDFNRAEAIVHGA